MQIPEVWTYETEEYSETDGTTSYSLNISANGKDIRSIDISWGIIPDGSSAYNEACSTYEEVVGEEDLSVNDEPIICFEFQKKEAHGFNVYTDEGFPCFFYCVEVPSDGQKRLVTVLLCAPNNEELQNLVDFVEEYLVIS